MRSDELDFDLPPDLIAQEPSAQRAASRLLHYQKRDRSVAHRQFSDLPRLLRQGDLLVFNNARVIAARLVLQKDTGGQVEGLFLAEESPGKWRVLLRNVGAGAGMTLRFPDHPAIALRIREKLEGGEYRVELIPASPAAEVLERVGRMPLPPYIRRERCGDARDALDRQRYQTVFASVSGAVAAPTAGLHFTPEVFRELDEAGVERAFVTLEVGMGTFKPLTADTLEEHVMHAETYQIDGATAEALNRAKSQRRRIIAVGTTSARVLESHPADTPFIANAGETRLFIHGSYHWKHVDAMITNFHLPRSTLIALVASMVGLVEQRRLYQIAIDRRYRFFSYGDAMFVE